MIKDSKVNREKVDWLLNQPLDVQATIMHQHLDICKLVINNLLKANVEALSGKRYCREKPYEGGIAGGVITREVCKVCNQKLPIDVPRLYDGQQDKHINVPVYDQMKKQTTHSEEMASSILHGISMRDYEQVASQLIDSFGLSPATISRQFVARGKEAIKAFCTRSLAEHRFVALLVDGKHLAAQQMIIVMESAIKGKKFHCWSSKAVRKTITLLGKCSAS